MTRHRFSADLRQEHAEATRAGCAALSIVAVFAIGCAFYAMTERGWVDRLQANFNDLTMRAE